jgi:hypothetical protein
LVGGRGLEPPASAMSTQCSNQLSYPPEATRIIPNHLKISKRDYQTMKPGF